jgi:hypothetical protein
VVVAAAHLYPPGVQMVLLARVFELGICGRGGKASLAPGRP